jgi:hypothetical protein
MQRPVFLRPAPSRAPPHVRGRRSSESCGSRAVFRLLRSVILIEAIYYRRIRQAASFHEVQVDRMRNPRDGREGLRGDKSSNETSPREQRKESLEATMRSEHSFTELCRRSIRGDNRSPFSSRGARARHSSRAHLTGTSRTEMGATSDAPRPRARETASLRAMTVPSRASSDHTREDATDQPAPRRRLERGSLHG